ncbi:methylase, partial [bacterium]|nr:methylase [bacterium]
NIPTITAKRTNLIYPSEVHEREEKYEAINLITDEINIGKPKQKRTENHYDYIMGNPPFVGHQWRSKEQQSDMDAVFKDFGNNHGKLDYVCCWYKKALDIIRYTNVRCAFVSTNSICQGESVAALWKPLFDVGLKIDFAWRTFRWDSESTQKAHVHCVIVGFSCRDTRGSRAENNAVERTATRQIFNADGTVIEAENINGYLLDAPNIFIQNRNRNLNPALPKMSKGSQPTDDRNLILSTDEKDELTRKYPESAKFIRRFMGADEFINNKKRYCLWLKDVAPNEYRKIPPVIVRLERVAEFRRKSPTASVQRDSEIPMLFTQIRQPETDYLAIPRVSSENRKYIPIGFISSEVIASDATQFIPDADLFLFGVLTSSVHNAWMRAVAGRLKSDYRYSPAVYNNFPWCDPTDVQKAKIEKTAQAILDARAKYPDSSLADLYDETTMPPDLRKAHKENDKAVLAAYSFDPKMSEAEIVAELFRMYEKLTEMK